MDEANATKATVEIRVKTTKDQVAELQQQIYLLQAQATESRAIADKVTDKRQWLGGGKSLCRSARCSEKGFIGAFP